MSSLYLNYSKDELLKEFLFFVESSGKLSIRSNHNKIIKYFQQDEFYKVEKELWNNDSIKEKVILNRCKYLNKHPNELTDANILSGFKISSIYYGYSGFNPLLAKWFFEKYNINSCYDPCGGWGHRMLGSTNLDLYIYNDISEKVCNNVRRIKNYFDMYNVKIYNNDATKFIPSEEFESIFTCPPYRNLEKYSSTTNSDILLNKIHEIYISRNCCKYLGIVMREDMMILDDFSEKIELSNPTSHLNKDKQHKYKEYLYIWVKNNI